MAGSTPKQKGKKSTSEDKKLSKGKKPSKEVAPEIVEIADEGEIDEEDEDEDEDSEDDGVDEEGMANLMKALGDEGLDDIGKMQLEVLAGGEEEEEDDDEEEDGEESDAEDIQDEEVVVENGESVVDDESDSEGGEEKETGNGMDTQEVALEDAESVDDDAVARQKVEIDNKVALDRILSTIKLDPKMPWTETLVVTYPETIDVDVEDDLSRELAFYKQALHSATAARKLADQHNFPFTRPSDYFAEMVKSDAHMERIRQRLLDETASIKKSEDKRKEREGKKYGKQVQIEKVKERERSKKDMEERLKGLKRKRKDGVDFPDANDDDAFDVAVEDAIESRPAKRSKDGPKMSRNKRDAKFGFGGQGRRSKQNTRQSTEQFDYGSSKRGGGKGGKGAKAGKPKRLGKSKRMASKR